MQEITKPDLPFTNTRHMFDKDTYVLLITFTNTWDMVIFGSESNYQYTVMRS